MSSSGSNTHVETESRDAMQNGPLVGDPWKPVTIDPWKFILNVSMYGLAVDRDPDMLLAIVTNAIARSLDVDDFEGGPVNEAWSNRLNAAIESGELQKHIDYYCSRRSEYLAKKGVTSEDLQQIIAGAPQGDLSDKGETSLHTEHPAKAEEQI